MLATTLMTQIVEPLAKRDAVLPIPEGCTGVFGVFPNSLTKGFLDYYPNSSLLLDIYSNLLDIDGV